MEKDVCVLVWILWFKSKLYIMLWLFNICLEILLEIILYVVCINIRIGFVVCRVVNDWIKI